MYKMEIIDKKTDKVIGKCIGTNDELTKWFQKEKHNYKEHSYRVHVSDYIEPIEKPKNKWWKFGKDKSL